MPRILIFNAMPREREQQLAQDGCRPFDRLIAQALNIHLPSDQPAEYITLRVANGERLPEGVAFEDFDGVWLSGSPFHAYDTARSAVREQIELVRAIWRAAVPAFGSCWGLQLMTAALGGSVRLNPRGQEIGVARQIRQTDAGRGHPMFRDKSVVFDSVAVHEDEIEALPTIGQVLASNNVSHIQAAVMRDGVRCFWGVQYHPEFDLEAVSAFISTETDHKLRDGLAQTPEPLGEIISNLRTLSRSPTRDDLSCRYDLSANILDAELRTLEFRNWLQSLVLPRESRRA